MLSAVTAAMLTAATPLQVIVAASPDGQVFTVTVCVQKGAGDPTVLCPVSVKMGLHAPLMMAYVNVHQGSEEPPVKESALLVFMGTAAARPAHSVCTAVGHATTSQASVTVCLASRVHSAMKYVRVEDLGKTVQESVLVPTMEPVTPLTDLVNVTLVGSAVTALNLVLLLTGAPTASTRATATMGPSAAPMMGNVNVRLAGRGSTALRGVLWGFMGRTAH